MNDTPKQRGRVLTGRMVLLIAVGAFAVVFAVNFYMMSRAIGGFPGLVVKNSYQAGVGFDERRAAQEALGWTMSARHEGSDLVVRMTGPDGAPLQGLDVSAVVGRPATVNEDRDVPLAASADGYRAPVDLAPGLWAVMLTARDAEENVYTARTEITVRPPK